MKTPSISFPGSFAEATRKLRDLFGDRRAANMIGKGPSRINHACYPDQETYCPLGVDQALRLDIGYARATGYEGPILRSYRRQYEEALADCRRVPASNPLVRISNLSRCSGDALQAVAEVERIEELRGGQADSDSRVVLLRALDELIGEAEALRRTYAEAGDVVPLQEVA